MKLTHRPLFVLLLLFVSGCGTIRNLSAPGSIRASNGEDVPKIVFGGIQHDCKQVRNSFHQLANRDDHSESAMKSVGQLLGGTVDSPFSLVGDTLTLPITIHAAIERAVIAYYFPEGRRQKLDEPQAASEVTDSAN